MKVEELVIDGFKSYSVRTVITNWDPQFNAITGLNGSGKSNILDAICFVLGITSTSSLRAQNLQELIYKKGQAGITKASVTITFDNSDKEHAPVAYINDPKISITRHISVDSPTSNSTKYLINGRKATQKEVTNLLQSVQLNINNPNFLIMQGKITQMLNMKPKQVLSLIEEAAGTKSYEIQRDASEKIMKKKDQKLATIKDTLTVQVEPKLAELLKQTEIYFEFKNSLTNREEQIRIREATAYESSSQTLSKITKELADTEAYHQKLTEACTNYENQIENLVNDINEIKSRNTHTESALLNDLESSEQSLQNEVTRLHTSKASKIENVKELTESIKLKEAEIEQVKALALSRKNKFNETQTDFLKEEENLKSFKEQLQRKEDLLSTLSTGISSKGGTDAGYASQLREANKRLTETKTVIEQYKLKIRHLQRNVNEKKLEEHKSVLSKYEIEKKKRQENCELIRDKLRRSGFDKAEYDKLKQEENNLFQELHSKDRYLQDFVRNDSRFDFTYDNPTPDFNPQAVKGLCGELFDLPENNKRTATALEVCAGYKLFNVVVDTDKTGSLLLEKGRLRKRVTIVPLNKITSRVVREDILAEAKRQAPDKVELALNLVEYDNSVKKAIEFIFGSKLICDDPETAKKVTFNNKIRTGSITLDGDNYDPEGRLSGGSRRTSSSLIAKFGRYSELKNEVTKIKQRLDQISKTLRKMNQAAEQNHDIQQQLISEEYQISILDKKLAESNSAIYVKSFEESSTQIIELNKLIELDENKMANIEAEIANINKDISEFNSDGSRKLRELKNEVSKMSAELNQREKILSKRRLIFNEEKVKNDDASVDLENLHDEIDKIKQELPKIEQSVKNDDIVIKEKQVELDELAEKIQVEKDRNAGYAKELNELSTHLQSTRNKLTDVKKAHEECTERLSSLKHTKKFAVNRMKEAVRLFKDVSNDEVRLSIIENNPGVTAESCDEIIAKCDERIAELKSRGADENILVQTETLKNHDASLRQKIKKIERDKVKIQSTIEKLDKYLDTELNKTFEKVSHEFGETFALLLPGSYAKLVKVAPDISKGLEVKVQLGTVWKQSLVELSGGQRSLVALALIMSLLQFRPAPMYILDEVDAALDLSHTQSIGQLIKTKFKGSQFIVVSLKEGMFTNANRLFKVRFQEGTSVVTTK